MTASHLEDPSSRLDREIVRLLPSQLSPRDTGPEALRPLLALLAGRRRRLPRLAAALTDLLIDMTVRRARTHSAFYGELYADMGCDGFTGAAQLATLPTIGRHDVDAAGAAIWCDDVTYGFSSYTSGTTKDRPLILARSREEQSELAALVRTGRVHPDPGALLVLATYNHGRQLQISSGRRVYYVGLAGKNGFRQARSLLARSETGDGVQEPIITVAGPTQSIRQLTAYLADSGTWPGRQAVREVHVSGQYLSTYARSWLADAWEATVVNRFSLTEVVSSAVQCDVCGLFHFDQFSYPEVRSTATGEVCTKGRGALLITSLVPVLQMTPLIRYETGDLVDVREVDCENGPRGFAMLGRSGSASTFRAKRETQFLSGGEVCEVLDEIPDVARSEDGPLTPSSAATAGNTPLFEISNQDECLRLTVELRYPPTAFPDRSKALVHQISEGLLSLVPWLDDPRLIRTTLVPPNSLAHRPTRP